MSVIGLNVDVCKTSLAEGIASWEDQQIIDLIYLIDGLVADGNFSEKLIKKLCISCKYDSQDLNLPFIDWSKV